MEEREPYSAGGDCYRFPAAVSSGLADRGDHLGRDSLLEPLRFGLAARQDEGPEAGLVDDGHLLSAAKGVY